MSSTRGREAAFPDLVAGLMQHTWLVLVYAVACVTSIYVLGRFATDLIIFAAIQLPTVALVSATAFKREFAFPRIPVIWLTTAALTLTVLVDEAELGWAPTGFALAAAALIVYGILRAIAGTVWEYGQRRDEMGVSSTIAMLIASWGATLQIALLALLWIRGDALELLLTSETGRLLYTGLKLVTLASPTTWFPTGLLVFGIAMLAAFRLRDDPYHPLDFDEVLPAGSPGITAALLATLRLPTWIATIIIGFLVHFMGQIWWSLKLFLDEWLGRMMLLVFALVLPVAGMTTGHWCYWNVAGTVAEYLGEPRHYFLSSVAAFISVHAFALAALSLYAFSIGPLLLRIRPATPAQALGAILAYASRDILLTMNAVGRVFSLFGVLFIALPVAALLPGSLRFGPFSTAYSALVVLALGYAFLAEFRRKRSSTSGALYD